MKEELITYAIEIVEEVEPLDSLFNGMNEDEATKKKEKAAIRRQLKKGNFWVWGTVRVIATFKGLTGKSSHLGCCSYRDEEQFTQEQGGYYEDLKQEAKEELLTTIKAGKEAFDALEM